MDANMNGTIYNTNKYTMLLINILVNIYFIIKNQYFCILVHIYAHAFTNTCLSLWILLNIWIRVSCFIAKANSVTGCVGVSESITKYINVKNTWTCVCLYVGKIFTCVGWVLTCPVQSRFYLYPSVLWFLQFSIFLYRHFLFRTHTHMEEIILAVLSFSILYSLFPFFSVLFRWFFLIIEVWVNSGIENNNENAPQHLVARLHINEAICHSHTVFSAIKPYKSYLTIFQQYLFFHFPPLFYYKSSQYSFTILLLELFAIFFKFPTFFQRTLPPLFQPFIEVRKSTKNSVILQK